METPWQFRSIGERGGSTQVVEAGVQPAHSSRAESAQSELIFMAQPPQSLRRKQYIQEDIPPSNLHNLSGKEIVLYRQKIVHRNG